MIRQSRKRGESKKRRDQTTDEHDCQSPELEQILTGIFDDGDEVEPADFYDPEDLRP